MTRYSFVTVLSPVAHKRASCLYSSRQQTFVHVKVCTIFVHVIFPSRILCSSEWCCRRSEGIRSSLLLSETLDRWAAVSARGIVVEEIAKRVNRGVSRICCGGEGMRGGDIDWLNFFRGLSQFHQFKIPFHMYFEFQKLKGRRESSLYCF